MANGLCDYCPHAVLDHTASGCITCSCGAVYEPADPEPAVVVEPDDEPAPGSAADDRHDDEA